MIAINDRKKPITAGRSKGNLETRQVGREDAGKELECYRSPRGGLGDGNRGQ